MNEELLSEKLQRIKDSTDRIRTKTNLPTAEIEDVAEAVENMKEYKLGTKTITLDGTYNALTDNVDGYSTVTVETNSDLSTYFTSSFKDGAGITQSQETSWYKCLLKLPPLHFSGTTCSAMFYYCPALEMDLSNFDTSNVTTMYGMFYQSKLETIKGLTSLDTSKVTSMKRMFYYCSRLTSLDLSSFNTTNVTDMSDMFYYCTKLTHLDIRNFDFTNVTAYSTMFGGTSASSGPPNNCLIIVKDNTAKNWIKSKFSRFTNIKTVAEYEG